MGKRKKNADFQKVKFKVGKKLPKSDNFTDTTFKSRSIVIRDQLKTSTGTAVSKNKHTLQELLGQTHHYNVNMRQSAVAGLRELLDGHGDVVRQQLGPVLDHSLMLCADRESAVRAAFLKLATLVLAEVNEVEMRPFFPTLGAHLCRALTHLSEGVRLDALRLLDLVAVRYPRFVATRASQLLQVFVDQISKSGSGQSGNPSSRRTLSVNPDSKLSEQRNRNHVLERVRLLLQTVVDNGRPAISAAMNANEGEWHASESCDLLKNLYYYCSEFTLSCSGASEPDDHVEAAGISGNMSSYISMLGPLLVECWVEALPSTGQLQPSGGHLVKGHEVAMLDNVASISALLWKLLARESLMTTKESVPGVKVSHGKALAKVFLSGFPYAAAECSSQKVKGKGQKTAPVEHSTADDLNVSIGCYIAALAAASHGSISEQAWAEQVLDFVACLLGRARPPALNKMARLLDCARLLLPQASLASTCAVSVIQAVRSLFENLLQKSLTDGIAIVLHFVRDLSLEVKSGSALETALAVELAPLLLDVLKGLSTFSVLKKCGMLATGILQPLVVHGQYRFTEHDFATCLSRLVELIGALRPDDASHVQAYLHRLIGLLYYSRESIGKSAFCPLGRLLRLQCEGAAESVATATASFCLHTLQHRYLNGGATNEADYISFLFSLLTEEPNFTSSATHDSNCGAVNHSAPPILLSAWRRSKVVCDVLSRFQNSSQLAELLNVYVHKIVAKFGSQLTASTCASLLLCTRTIDDTADMAPSMLLLLVRRLLLLLPACEAECSVSKEVAGVLADVLCQRRDVLPDLVHSLEPGADAALKATSLAVETLSADVVLGALAWLLSSLPAAALADVLPVIETQLLSCDSTKHSMAIQSLRYRLHLTKVETKAL